MNEEIKKKIEQLKDYVVSQMEQANPGEHQNYYRGYIAGYAKAIDDALALFD